MAGKHVQPGFFDLEERYARLSRAGDPLEALNKAVDWELGTPGNASIGGMIGNPE